MFSSSPNYSKLKTHLRLAINRLKLLEKKKTELAQKARKEIADYIAAGKAERAKIRVEYIIREDYMVEAMEVVEMYCDLLLARFGLVTQMKDLDDGLAEAISSLIWVSPRMQTDIQELKVISDLLSLKYGKPFADTCHDESNKSISEKLKHKLSVQSPPKILVEKYLIEIAKIYNVEYEPDPQVMKMNQPNIGLDSLLIDLGGSGGPGGMPQPPGFVSYPQPPMPPLPPPHFSPFDYPQQPYGPPGDSGYHGPGGMPPPGDSGYRGPGGMPPPGDSGYHGPGGMPPPGEKSGFHSAGGFVIPSTSSGNQPMPPMNYNIPPCPEKKDVNTSFLEEEMDNMPPAYDSLSPDDNLMNSSQPKPQPRSKFPPGGAPAIYSNIDFPEIPNLPNVPADNDFSNVPGSKSGPSAPKDDIDFDDLTRRFEELKKKK